MLRRWQSGWLFDQAQQSIRRNRRNEAITLYRMALEANPKSSGAWLHLGLALSETGDYPAAGDCINHAMALQPKNPVHPAFLGLIHYDHGVYDEATKAFEQAARVDPEYHYANILKNLADFTQGRMEEAYAAFRTNYHWGLEFESRLLLACERYLRQNPGKAVSFYHSELSAVGATAPKYGSRIRRIWGGLQFGVRESATAVFGSKTTREMRRALVRAEKWNYLGDFRRALAGFGNVAAQPDSPLFQKILCQSAEICLGIGEFENFLGYVKQIPEYRETLAFLDNPSDRPSNPAEYPTLHPELLLALGIVYYETGSLSRAQDALLLAATFDPKNYLCYYYLGLCDMARITQDHPPDGELTIQQLQTARLWFKKALLEVNPQIVAKRAAETIRVFHDMAQ